MNVHSYNEGDAKKAEVEGPIAAPTHFVVLSRASGFAEYRDPLGQSGRYTIIGWGDEQTAAKTAKVFVETHGQFVTIVEAKARVHAKARVEKA